MHYDSIIAEHSRVVMNEVSVLRPSYLQMLCMYMCVRVCLCLHLSTLKWDEIIMLTTKKTIKNNDEFEQKEAPAQKMKATCGTRSQKVTRLQEAW